MVTIEVNLLTGRYYASKFNDLDAAEWPPHPARLFSALVATWADSDDPAEDERAALEWLEKQCPPDIKASDAEFRAVVDYFVPVNDTIFREKKGGEKEEYRKKRLAVEKAHRELEAVLGDIRSTQRKAQSTTELDKQLISKEKALNEARDTLAIDVAKDLLPENRTHAKRTFPSVAPQNTCISYVWDAEISPDLFSSLDSLTARLTRLGHSASLVSCLVRDKSPTPNWIPSDFALEDQKMRWVRSGQLARLVEMHERRTSEKTRFLPSVSVPYKKTETSHTNGSVGSYTPDTHGKCYFFEFLEHNRHMPISQAVRMTDTFRRAVLHYAGDPQPEGLSGHQVNGRPSESPHVVFAAVPHVGYRGDGRVIGLLMIVPPESVMDAEARIATFKAIANWEQENESLLELKLGKAGVFQMRRVRDVLTSKPDSKALEELTWTEANCLWRSVTPIALPTHPGNLHKGTLAARSKAWARAEDAVKRSCEHIGLPSPEQINLSRDPFWEGSPPAGKFPVFKQGSNPAASFNRALVHAEVLFDRPVKGPLLLGAGRYRGLGLMRPVSVKSQAKAQVKQHA